MPKFLALNHRTTLKLTLELNGLAAKNATEPDKGASVLDVIKFLAELLDAKGSDAKLAHIQVDLQALQEVVRLPDDAAPEKKE